MSSVTPSEFKVYDYLVKTPACNQTRESICEFIEKSKEYQLAKAEVLNIINIRPSSAVEIVPIIEEWENRMEDKIEELAEMIVEVLPPGPSPPDEPNTEEEPNADDEPAMDVSAEATDGKVNNGDEQMEES
uniref:DNA-directed RNA polymerase III subunit RPC9 n=2 Tax=Opuntia streptacantha TaxID=393608 RepID=A0A7C8ZFQ4_OPUST